MKKPRRLLLATAALSTAAALEACSKEPLPGNPKGSHYEDAAVALPGNPKGSRYDDGLAADAAPPPKPEPTTTDATSDAGATPPKPIMPGNPKGSHYDNGLKPQPSSKPTPPKK